MCFAFGEPEYEVDDNLAIIERQTAMSDDKVQAFLGSLDNDDMDRLFEMLKKKQDSNHRCRKWSNQKVESLNGQVKRPKYNH